MANIWAKFRSLLPQDPLLIGTVQTLNPDGSSTVLLPGGGLVRARGQAVAAGEQAFVQGGEIVGAAPPLTAYEVDV